jgi:Fe-S oxidoreductase
MEEASPRGKVQLAKHFFEGNLNPSKRHKEILMTCLLCETFMVNCPSGVQHDQIFADLRSQLVREHGVGWKKRLL